MDNVKWLRDQVTGALGCWAVERDRRFNSAADELESLRALLDRIEKIALHWNDDGCTGDVAVDAILDVLDARAKALQEQS